MKPRKKLRDRIRRKENKLQDLEAFRNSIDHDITAGKAYVEALKESLKLMPDDDGADAGGVTELRPGSDIARVRTVLELLGQPLHVSKLVEALGKEPTRANRSSMAGSIGAYVRKGEFFQKFGPNIFGLIGMQPSKETGIDDDIKAFLTEQEMPVVVVSNDDDAEIG